MPKAVEPIIIKKYANRRLYNTETSSYVTLEDLAHMVKEGREFEVVDAKTGTDMTRGVLTQIIFEEESKKGDEEALMPISFLRQMIKYYDHTLQGSVPNWLEMSMQMFAANQKAIAENTEQFMSTVQAMQGQAGTSAKPAAGMEAMNMFNPFANVQGMQGFQEMQRKNMEMFQQGMEMWNPFMKNANKQQKEAELKAQIDALQAELEKVRKAG